MSNLFSSLRSLDFKLIRISHKSPSWQISRAKSMFLVFLLWLKIILLFDEDLKEILTPEIFCNFQLAKVRLSQKIFDFSRREFSRWPWKNVDVILKWLFENYGADWELQTTSFWHSNLYDFSMAGNFYSLLTRTTLTGIWTFSFRIF